MSSEWNAEGRHDILTHIRARVVEGRQAREVISPGRSCYFLKDGWCSIHETKPVVCRNFLCLIAIELKAKNNCKAWLSHPAWMFIMHIPIIAITFFIWNYIFNAINKYSPIM
jgi:Fe-S-cluster containining protein